ncbi:uncharacterized protein LOC110838683 isoform X2 [Zootermopsis nevadensis]|uniref:uncharacterized protein LOC110838683 isoform X2 n=1 Tax=Zootermopsis nevadensis TaxID=136037 RepID=UPI000B8E30A7|nr:uncharacterized protein LOC110838683 isoform X2 [Zootermopsis nevadensis]
MIHGETVSANVNSGQELMTNSILRSLYRRCKMIFQSISKIFCKLYIISFALMLLARQTYLLSVGDRQWLLLSNGEFVDPDWKVSPLQVFNSPPEPVMIINSEQSANYVIVNIITAVMMIWGTVMDWTYVFHRNPFEDQVDIGEQTYHNFINVFVVILVAKSLLWYATIRCLRSRHNTVTR